MIGAFVQSIVRKDGPTALILTRQVSAHTHLASQAQSASRELMKLQALGWPYQSSYPLCPLWSLSAHYQNVKVLPIDVKTKREGVAKGAYIAHKEKVRAPFTVHTSRREAKESSH